MKKNFHEFELEVSIKIYEMLFDSFLECNKLVDLSNNLQGIFFHEILRILTNFFYKSNSLNSKYSPDKNDLSNLKHGFPYIDYTDILSGIDISRKNFKLDNVKSFKKTAWNILVKILSSIFSSYIRVGLGKNVPLKNSIIFQGMRKKIFFFFIQDSKITITKKREQLRILNSIIERISEEVFHSNKSDELFQIIEKHINNRLSEKQSKFEFDAVVIGSPGEELNMFTSVISSRSKIPVVHLMHGEGDQIFYDEPRHGFSEKYLVDYMFGHGAKKSYVTLGTDFLNVIPGTASEYIGSNSNFIKKIYKKKKVRKILSNSKIKWMYVPDSIQFDNQWGPYGNYMNPYLYLHWQRKIVSNFPRIIYKRHPKGSNFFRKVSNERLRDLLSTVGSNNDFEILLDNFYSSYDKCDAYVFDSVSTAFMIACATEKPIIFFNIGKRKFTNEAEELIKERCYWFDQSPEENINYLQIISEISNRDKVNNFTEWYSLDKMSAFSREISLLNIISQLYDKTSNSSI